MRNIFRLLATLWCFGNAAIAAAQDDWIRGSWFLNTTS